MTTEKSLTFDIESVKKEAEAFMGGLASMQLGHKKLAALPLNEWDDDVWRSAVDLRNEAASRVKKITDKFEPLRKAAQNLKDMILSMRDDMTKPYDEIKDALTKKAEAYSTEQLRAKREADKKLDKLAEQQRRDLTAQSQELIGQGRFEDAENMQRQANVTLAPTLPDAMPVSDSASNIEKLIPKVNDMIAFLKEIVEGRQPLMWEYRGELRAIVDVNMPVLNAVVGRQRKGFKWNGVTVSEEVKLRAKNL